MTDRRIRHYLSALANGEPRTYDVKKDAPGVLCNALDTPDDLLGRYAFRYSAEQFAHLHHNYIAQAQKVFGQVDPFGRFIVFPEDLRQELPFPAITKSRVISTASTCVLLPLNYQRHWQDVWEVAKFDVPFDQKNDKLVWRGATTGRFLRGSSDNPYSSRFYVHGAKFRHENIDIGYSVIGQVPDPLAKELQASVKIPLSMADQLQCKFLLSLEGNDVASGLKWMLYSNSTVVMPKPICESWACESLLVPFEHYVPVKHDLSDLDDVCEWCMGHLAECKDIAENAKRYIADFLITEKEDAIKAAVAAGYLGKVSFV